MSSYNNGFRRNCDIERDAPKICVRVSEVPVSEVALLAVLSPIVYIAALPYRPVDIARSMMVSLVIYAARAYSAIRLDTGPSVAWSSADTSSGQLQGVEQKAQSCRSP